MFTADMTTRADGRGTATAQNGATVATSLATNKLLIGNLANNVVEQDLRNALAGFRITDVAFPARDGRDEGSMTALITLEHISDVDKAIDKANTIDLFGRPMSAQKATTPTNSETFSMHTMTPPPKLSDAVELGPVLPAADTTATQSTPIQMETPAQCTGAAAGGPAGGEGSGGGGSGGNGCGNGETTGGSGALGEAFPEFLDVIVHRDTIPFKIRFKKSEKRGMQKFKLCVQDLVCCGCVLEHPVSPTFEELKELCQAWASDMKDLRGCRVKAFLTEKEKDRGSMITSCNYDAVLVDGGVRTLRAVWETKISGWRKLWEFIKAMIGLATCIALFWNFRALTSVSKGSGTTTTVTTHIPATTTSYFTTQNDFILQELRYTTDLAVVSSTILDTTCLVHTKPTNPPSHKNNASRTRPSVPVLALFPAIGTILLFLPKLFMAFVCWADRILEIYYSQVDMDIDIARGEYAVPSNAAPLGVSPEMYRDVFPFIRGNDILRILKAGGFAPEIPEDLYHLIKKVVAVRKRDSYTFSTNQTTSRLIGLLFRGSRIGSQAEDQSNRGEVPKDDNPTAIRITQSPQDLVLYKTSNFDAPVYSAWDACEDVCVLEKFRSAEYHMENLYLVDENDSKLFEVGTIKLRLLGLGSAVVMHELFDNGDGRTTIAGGQGSVSQMGELIETALATFDHSETRIFVSHMSPGKEGLLAQLALALRASVRSRWMDAKFD